MLPVVATGPTVGTLFKPSPDKVFESISLNKFTDLVKNKGKSQDFTTSFLSDCAEGAPVPLQTQSPTGGVAQFSARSGSCGIALCQAVANTSDQVLDPFQTFSTF